MKDVRIICDRCGAAILEDRATLAFKVGTRRHDGELDLCADCTERFGEFMRGPRECVHNGHGTLNGLQSVVTA